MIVDQPVVIAKEGVSPLTSTLENRVIAVEDSTGSIVGRLESGVSVGALSVLPQVIVDQFSGVAKKVVVQVVDEDQPSFVSIDVSEVIGMSEQKVLEEEKEGSHSQKAKASVPDNTQSESIEKKSSRGFFCSIGSRAYNFFACCFSGVWKIFSRKKG